MIYKAILSGRLEFGNPRSCEKAMQLFQSRVEIIYRGDVFLKMDEVFNVDKASLDLYRFSAQVSEKSWNNTTNLLDEVAKFAITGKIDAWLTDNGQVKRESTIEPLTEKAAIQAYIHGRELIGHKGSEQEAIDAFSQAIEKYERHASAYERRGYVNYRLGNYNDALYDYNKSITLNPAGAEAYLGRAVVHIAQKNYAAAIPDLDKAIKCSVPLQPVFWIARRIKGDCHLELEQHEDAIKEYNFFLKRDFKPGDVNFQRRRRVAFRIGKALLSLRKNREALQAFENALKIQSDDAAATDADVQAWRQEAMKRIGNSQPAAARAAAAV